MAYGLPVRGQADWDDEVNNSIEALKATADSALAKANVASSTALSAEATANQAAADVAALGTPVTSVNGEGGAVVLGAADVGAAATVHTHTSAAVTDFTEAVQDAVAALLAAGVGVTIGYDDAGNVLTITAVTGTGTDPEQVRDVIGVALNGIGNITVTADDVNDTITISTTATVNSTDAALRDRSTHTGTQAISTVSDLQTALDGKAASTHLHTGTYAPVDSPTFTGVVTAAALTVSGAADLPHAAQTNFDLMGAM